MAKQYYYLEDEIFAEFKKLYPELCERGMTHHGHGFETIRIRMPKKGCVEYNRFRKSLTWLDHNGDKQYETTQRNKRRESMYKIFIESVNRYISDNNITQSYIAELSGISRQKINEYINGKSIPKVSTMYKILNSLNVDVSEIERSVNNDKRNLE